MACEGEEEFNAELPAGYRFMPTDEELVSHYLMNKVFCKPVPGEMVQDIDATQLYSKPPRSLVQFSCGEREWFFFIQEDDNVDGKSSSKTRRNVGDEIGFWQWNGDEKPIYNSDGNVSAFKIRFVYFSGTLSKAKKTHWKMDQYRLPTYQNFKGEEWVLGRVKRGMDYDNYF